MFSLEESKKNLKIDMEWVNRIVPRKTLHLRKYKLRRNTSEWTRKDLEREIKRLISIGKKYGRFFISLGSPLIPENANMES